MGKDKKQTPLAAKVVAVLIAAAAITCIVLWVTNAPPAAKLKARWYAGRIGEGGDNGSLSIKMINLGTDASLPAALDMLKSSDYIARKYAIIIIGKLEDKVEVRKATDSILEIMKTEDVPRNRSELCAMVGRLYRRQPKYCWKIIRFLKDPDEQVRGAAKIWMQKIADVDRPGQPAEYWLKWWEDNKERLNSSAADNKEGGANTAQ